MVTKAGTCQQPMRYTASFPRHGPDAMGDSVYLDVFGPPQYPNMSIKVYIPALAVRLNAAKAQCQFYQGVQDL